MPTMLRQPPIARHKTAIARTELSRPVKRAIADGILSQEHFLFDYGCGQGDDLRTLYSMGFNSAGWDPVHLPNEPLHKAPIVNLGYVINVIEKTEERQEVLRRAWALTQEVLIVSARITAEARFKGTARDYGDGFLTNRGTFQKFYDQQELKNWIDQSLSVVSVPAAPGMFYVFRDDKRRNTFVASRYRRRLSTPRPTKSAQLYHTHENLLQPLMSFIGDRGRLPADDELSNRDALCEVFGSIGRAFQVIKRVTNARIWDTVTEERTQDLLIFLGLSRFDERPRFGQLPLEIQRDVKGFYSSYKQACEAADCMLFSLGKPGVVDTACRISEAGKTTPHALYVHQSALTSLPPILRLLEGCAQNYIGRVDDANVIKLYRTEPKISYLSYPDFETDPHPALDSSLTVNLQTLRVRTRTYNGYRNPPILHRKESFLATDHPLRPKFARLTRIEEDKGLYEESSRIGTLKGWNDVLAEKGLFLKGHRLLRQHAK